MINNRRELTYSGMVGLVSTALLKCFRMFGSPSAINHGESGLIYAEFKNDRGACTFYTTKINEHIFSLHIVPCQDTLNRILDELDAEIKKTLNDPSLFNLVLLPGENDEQ
jgi:hypothetical protein